MVEPPDPRAEKDELYVSRWFKANYRLLGYERIVGESEQEYRLLRKRVRKEVDRANPIPPWTSMGTPDYLALKDGKWFRIEIESVSSHFNMHHHTAWQRDVLICYEYDFLFNEDRPAEVIALYDLFYEHKTCQCCGGKGRWYELRNEPELSDQFKKFAEETRAL